MLQSKSQGNNGTSLLFSSLLGLSHSFSPFRSQVGPSTTVDRAHFVMRCQSVVLTSWYNLVVGFATLPRLINLVNLVGQSL